MEEEEEGEEEEEEEEGFEEGLFGDGHGNGTRRKRGRMRPMTLRE